MIIDKYTEFADATALSTAGTGRALVGNVVNLEEVTKAMGVGQMPYLVILVSTAVTSAGAATVSFELASDAQASIATDGSASVHFATAAIPKATLVAGYQAAVVKLPVGNYEQYLGILQNVGTAALTAGAIKAFLTLEYPNWYPAPDGI